jgi:hypothetical protein
MPFSVPHESRKKQPSDACASPESRSAARRTPVVRGLSRLLTLFLADRILFLEREPFSPPVPARVANQYFVGNESPPQSQSADGRHRAPD